MEIKQLIEDAHAQAIKSGWWVERRNIGELFMLMASEVTEAFEHYRNGYDPDEVFFMPVLVDDGNITANKPDGVPIELADVVIRIADFCGEYNIDLEKAIEMKMRFNAKRSKRHGGKRA